MPSTDPKQPIHLPDSLADAERFQRLFVQPMVEAVRAELENQLGPLATKVDWHDKAIADLRGKQTKALIGWGVYATVASVGIGAAWGWIKSKIHWG